MKTKEELCVLKEEVEAMSKKLCALADDELEQVAGGVFATYGCTGDCGGRDVASCFFPRCPYNRKPDRWS